MAARAWGQIRALAALCAAAAAILVHPAAARTQSSSNARTAPEELEERQKQPREAALSRASPTLRQPQATSTAPRSAGEAQPSGPLPPAEQRGESNWQLRVHSQRQNGGAQGLWSSPSQAAGPADRAGGHRRRGSRRPLSGSRRNHAPALGPVRPAVPRCRWVLARGLSMRLPCAPAPRGSQRPRPPQLGDGQGISPCRPPRPAAAATATCSALDQSQQDSIRNSLISSCSSVVLTASRGEQAAGQACCGGGLARGLGSLGAATVPRSPGARRACLAAPLHAHLRVFATCPQAPAATCWRL